MHVQDLENTSDRRDETQGRSQEFDLVGYKWVKETKQPHKKN